MKRKLLSILLSVLIALICIPLGGVSVSAEEYTQGVYTYKVSNDGKATIVKYNGAGGEVIIPDTLGGFAVVEIGKDAFRFNKYVVSVKMPNTITVIGENAFFECISLTNIVFSNNLTVIGDFSFDTCLALTEIEIPDSVVSIGEGAFGNCGFKEVIIPDNVTTLGDYAFQVCMSLEKVVIGKGVSVIGRYMFGDCHKLSSVVLPHGVTTIEAGAFNWCDSIAHVYYAGTAKDRANILDRGDNDALLNATWHYNCINPKDHYSANVQHSVMDTENGNGLAFKFELTASVGYTGKNKIDLANATINYLGQTCKLVGMGAVVTNQEGVVPELGNVNGKTIVDIPTVYLTDWELDSCAFATRIINIPDSALDRTIYARPYYVIETNGEQIVVYGELNSATAAEYMA